MLICEGTPKNPETIIVQNQFYPSGLTEERVYDYYQKMKSILIKRTENRDVMFFIAVKTNQFIVKRKYSNSFIKLTNDNYDRFMHGRNVSVHSTMNEKERFGIIDIDWDSNFDNIISAVGNVYDFLNHKKFFPKIDIRFTGKTSFHIIVYYDKSMTVNNSREFLTNLLSDNLQEDYLINKKRSITKPNLDLSSNKIRGGFITPYSLSTFGLICTPIDRNQLKSFRKEQAIL